MRIHTVWFLFLIGLALEAAPALGQSQEDCLACHGDAGLQRSDGDGNQPQSLFIDKHAFDTSVHAALQCTDCHAGVQELPHPAALPHVDCAGCHDAEGQEFAKSVHVNRLRPSRSIPVSCKHCHGTHDIRETNDPASLVNPANVSDTCGSCHARPAVQRSLGRANEDPMAAYGSSVHARKGENGVPAATCVSCHDSHAILPRASAESTLSKVNIPEMCGKCHARARDDYKQSIHWWAANLGNMEAPVCNDCHGDHRTIGAEAGSRFTQPLAVSELCAGCHANRTAMDRVGLDPERFSSYMKTYHGLAVLRGSPDAASCASCHEMHAVRRASDPASSVAPRNLQQTCGKCHGNVSPQFVQINVHPRGLEQRNPIAALVRSVYVWLIALTIVGMLVHNLVIHSYFLRKKWREEHLHPRTQRFSAFQVVQHLGLALSFSVLVVTGFALKFPQADWVQLLSTLGMSEVVRGNLHRIAAVVLMAGIAVQLIWFVVSPLGRRDLLALRPTVGDVTGVWQNIRFHLRMSGRRPQEGHFNYVEKSEYLALLWGTLVMIASGLVLWFPKAFLQMLPAWVFEVAEVVHYYEAWLAFLAIVVWHFYFVIFHPEQYPMSFTWLNGKVPKGMHSHGREEEEQRPDGQP